MRKAGVSVSLSLSLSLSLSFALIPFFFGLLEICAQLLEFRQLERGSVRRFVTNLVSLRVFDFWPHGRRRILEVHQVERIEKRYPQLLG